MGKDKVKVGVRIRPLNLREKNILNSSTNRNSSSNSSLITKVPKNSTNQIILCPIIPGNTTNITNSNTSNNNNNNNSNTCINSKKSFTFDYVFDLNASQEDVFESLGEDLLESAFEGYNGCLFAYGQTSSGKSYTMLGNNEHQGVIPRLCDAIFRRINEERKQETTEFKVEVSYMEIYNEKVRDLLIAGKTSLKVREHSILGPYVDGLSLLAVKSAEDVATLMIEGNKSRTVAATNMNSESSRSHAVFTIVMTQTITDQGSGVTGEKVSKLSLVDLAGSERAVKTGAVGERLKEGSNINKSLTTLGLVISKLADGANNNTNNSKESKIFIPYRDSVLTWLLKDNLGGNSRTIMIATVSPSPDNYEETLSTLRYADRAKRIVNNAVVNEDPNAKLIRELQAEVKQLRELLKSHVSDKGLNEQLTQSEKLMRQVSETWEEKLVRSEQAQQERQAALEKMGISVQKSGISVEKDRFYLVNLNADPALNELLVYYLKEDRTIVGRPDATEGPPDVQLTGLGIEPLHCELVIEPDQTLYLIPYPNAHTCVNGERIVERRKILRHGDRILWGNHHFFRLNSPLKLASSSSGQNSTHPSASLASAADGISSNVDTTTTYEQASAEFSLKQLIQSDPIHEAVAKLECKHKKDKEVALEKQRQEFERQFTAMMHVLSPSATIPPALPWDSHAQNILQQQQQQHQNLSSSNQVIAARNTKITEGLKLLKEYLLKANQMVREANEICMAMKIPVKYSVTLLIPPNNLTPNRPKGSLVTEPSIRVEQDGHYPQIWSLEKLQNRLVDMRELYDEFTSVKRPDYIIRDPLNEGPPAAFFEPDVPHVLLGIANVFLQVLFYDEVTLKYPVPVINQQGEIVGRLHVEVAKVSTGCLESSKMSKSSNQYNKLENSLYEEYDTDEDGYFDSTPRTITVKVTIRHLAGVASSHYIFCQYMFCDQHVVVPPSSTTSVVRFDQTKYFTVPISEEFIDYCTESALAIEVWGHRGNNQIQQLSTDSSVCSNNMNGEYNNSVTDRWKEVTSQMKIWVEIQELNENGDYVAVEVENDEGMISGTGGIHQLRQGLQRRILITVETSSNAGQLPIVCDEIDQLSLGAISVRSTTKQRPLDSYQEVELAVLRERWGDALKRRRDYLDRHLQELAGKQNKSSEEQSREKSLVNQWLTLTEERNAVLVPAPDSGVPGAPPSSEFRPEVGMEDHVPVMFLDISDDILSADSSPHSPLVAGHTSGLNSLLPKEHDAHFVSLPIIRKSYGDFYSAWSDQRMSNESWALVSWDSSVHDCLQLNKPTPSGEVIYVILRIAIRLSHPVQMDCILRKRICVFVKRNRASLTERLRARFTMKKCDDNEQERKRRTGVTYQIVSHLPKSSEQLETRESLANLAVSHGESYIEEYIRSISAVDSILNLDRMRQSVYLREEQVKTRPRNTFRLQTQQGLSGSSISVGNFMRKTLSVPNISQLFVPQIPTSNRNNQENGILNHLEKSNENSGNHQQLSSGDGFTLGGFNRKVRSESLANLSGFASPPSGGSTPTTTTPNPQQSRPSSLNLGHQISTSPLNGTPHSTKWTSMMTTVVEEESSGYGSQKSSEDSPITNG